MPGHGLLGTRWQAERRAFIQVCPQMPAVKTPLVPPGKQMIGKTKWV